MEETEFLQGVKEILKDRKRAYGDATPLFEKISKKWSVTLNHKVTAEQVMLCMIDFKSVRYQQDGSHKEDSAFDIAGYSALLSNFFE